MLHKYKNDNATLDINIVPRNESRKAQRSLPKQNKILVWCYQKFEKQKTETRIKLNIIQHLHWPRYTDLLKPNHNSEFQVWKRI